MVFPKYSASGMILAADWDDFVLAMVAHSVRHAIAGSDPIITPLDARALALSAQGDIVYLSGVANTLARLAPGVAGQVLMTGGAAANPSWGAAAPAAHAASHEPAGADEVNDVDIGNTGVLLSAHAARHENAGADEISVLGLSGLLADDQHVLDAEVLLVAAALVHAPRHKDGGADELDVSELAGAIGAAGEVPETDGAAVTWVDPDGRYVPLAHAASHKDGGADELDVSELAGALGGAGEIPETDGAAVTWVDPDSRYVPAAHTLATTGPHNAPLPLTDLEVGVQGEVVIRGAVDWEALAVGVALQALISGGVGVTPSWGAPTPAAHEASHRDGGSDELEIDDLPGAAGAAGEIVESDGAAMSFVEPDGRYAPAAHQASHNDGGADEIEIDTLPGANGAAGEIVESDGAAMSFVDPDGRYDPKAHVLATTGPHSAPLPLIDLEVGVQGEVIHRGAVDWEALPVGNAADVLTSGGAGANVVWAAPGAPGAHEASHVKGGADDIDSALDARAIALTAQGEIVFHAAAANTLAALPVGVAGQALLSGGAAADVSWGAPATVAHAPTHKDGGTDELDVAELAGALGSAGEIPESDGAAVSWVDPDGRYDPKAHEVSHVKGGADDIDATLDGRAIAITTQGDLVHGSAANTINRLAAGTAGQTLQTGGGAANPSWTWNKRMDAAPDATDTGNGLTSLGVIGENVIAGDVLYLKADGKYWKADADAAAMMPAKVMAMADGAAEATVELLHIGFYREDSRWNWTVGNGEANLLFVHTTAGDMVQLANQPAGAGDQVQVLGYVVTADIVFFNPSLELVEIS